MTTPADVSTAMDAHAVHSSSDSEARLKSLLDQQALIQAEIRSLMPVETEPNFQAELVMLNHKHKMLKATQEELGFAPVVLSEAEECRMRQYMCECIETACLHSDAFSSIPDLLQRASLPLRSIQPNGFDDWLQLNASKYDLVLKTHTNFPKATSSLKCLYPTCIHFIYGFATFEHLELHNYRSHPKDTHPMKETTFFHRLSSPVLHNPLRTREESSSNSRISDRTFSFVPEYPQNHPQDSTAMHSPKRIRLAQDEDSKLPSKELSSRQVFRNSNETDSWPAIRSLNELPIYRNIEKGNHERGSTREELTTPKYTEVRQDRIFCPQCNNHPDGFRGEHELRRHQDREHRATIKKWIIIDPNRSSEDEPQPILPLSRCKSCSEQKKGYGAYYNAAAHLRRTHFRPKDRKGTYLEKEEIGRGKGPVDWPPMSVLKHWMKEVEVPQQGSPGNSDDDDDDGVESEFNMSTPGPLPPKPSVPPIPSTFSSVNATSIFRNSAPFHPLQPSPSSYVRNGIEAPYPPNEPGRRDRCPYPECSKVFKDLKAHLLTHQNERPEKCPITTCDYHTKGFARKYDKNRHALTHYRGTMTCPFCAGSGTPIEKTFTRADVFKRHLTGVHGVEQTPPNSRNRPESTRKSVPSGQNGKCSICKVSFDSAQMYYDHLDECVLGVIVPETIQSKSESLSTAESSTA
ncbi:C2H2 and C2HC zinc finger [Glarea lozoyensis ATCC 20868]|uniref:C2H2 and C2HC zinc finger n=1 Tax=Glarea lozoyensis (strain ATCC 20868 / MF5171) TaxID=1116229 RepID=S3DCT4_GLAL2|nr:C2H2 and C2HC zinc finger [Glarea lozoyensis ATCC 20868]EPE24508.1 C2H2 and C2HC zinc finger [Glarea lozoyensis ATCC 20868]